MCSVIDFFFVLSVSTHPLEICQEGDESAVCVPELYTDDVPLAVRL